MVAGSGGGSGSTNLLAAAKSGAGVVRPRVCHFTTLNADLTKRKANEAAAARERREREAEERMAAADADMDGLDAAVAGVSGAGGFGPVDEADPHPPGGALTGFGSQRGSRVAAPTSNSTKRRPNAPFGSPPGSVSGRTSPKASAAPPSSTDRPSLAQAQARSGSPTTGELMRMPSAAVSLFGSVSGPSAAAAATAGAPLALVPALIERKSSGGHAPSPSGDDELDQLNNQLLDEMAEEGLKEKIKVRP
jgi:hypothetical protein